MGRSLIAALALVALAGCNSSAPTEQEQNLSERGTGPEQRAGSASTTAAQNSLDDSMPEQPGGPSSDRGSGTGGDTTSR